MRWKSQRVSEERDRLWLRGAASLCLRLPGLGACNSAKITGSSALCLCCELEGMMQICLLCLLCVSE